MSALRGAPVAARAMLAGALVALAVAGCGSAGVSAPAYVKSICGSLAAWKASVQSAGSKLQSSGAGTASPASAKQDYLAFVSALDHATEHAASALRSAGAPSVTNGKQIAARLSGAFAGAAGGLAAAYAGALAIPTNSATAFEHAASVVTGRIKSSLEGIATVSPEDSAPLRAAATADPTCQALKG